MIEKKNGPSSSFGLRRGSLRSPLRYERRLVEAAGVEPALLHNFINDFSCLIFWWTTYEQQFTVNHLEMSVNRDKILKQIIPPINTTDTCQWRSLHKWSNSESYRRRGRIFFLPISIQFILSRQVAGRTRRLVSPSPNGSPEWKSVYNDSLEKLKERLLQNILNHIDCQPWAEMKWPVLNWRDGVFGMVLAKTADLKLFWDPKTVLAIFVGYDMDICNKLSWLILQINSSCVDWRC